MNQHFQSNLFITSNFFSLTIPSTAIMPISPILFRHSQRNNRLLLNLIVPTIISLSSVELFNVIIIIIILQYSFFVLAKQVFSASPLLIYLLDLCRIPLKNSFDTYFVHFVDDSVDDILADEENIIDVIHALRGNFILLSLTFKSSFLDKIFPNDAEKKG